MQYNKHTPILCNINDTHQVHRAFLKQELEK